MMQDILLSISWAQALGVFFSVLQVTLATRNNSNTYLFGIAGIVLSLYVLFTAKLYADFTLSLYYLVMSIYGWLYWKFGKQKQEVAISVTSTSEKGITVAIVAGTFTFFWFFLTHYTDSDVPIWDSVATAFAWAGMWLMAKRKLANWVLLNISNVISIPLLVYKELYLYALLTVFLFVMGCIGYIKWYKLLKQQDHANV